VFDGAVAGAVVVAVATAVVEDAVGFVAGVGGAVPVVAVVVAVVIAVVVVAAFAGLGRLGLLRLLYSGRDHVAGVLNMTMDLLLGQTRRVAHR